MDWSGGMWRLSDFPKIGLLPVLKPSEALYSV